MESSLGPIAVDELILQYRLQRKIKVFNTSNTLPNKGYNLVACSSKYGLVFVGTPDRILTVYYLKDLVDKDCEPQHMSINLQEAPTHLAVSSDQELLAVTGGQLLSVYNIFNFQNTSPQPINIPLNKPSTFVSGLQWNPIIADNLAMVFYDGSLLVANIHASQVKMVQSKARCLCWSPKGKQLVTGNSDGTLTQYKPDLTPAKNIPAPNLFQGAPIEALAVYWISTFMFAVVFKNATDNSRPVVTIVNTPKVNPPYCLNYEDICYSMGTNRPWYYYLQAIPQWSIIMASSSNSMEIATLGSKKEGESWTQWCQSDEARPELPLTDKKIENFPVGISIDTSAIYQIPNGENQSLHPMPLLHVLSQNGLLTIFNVINLSNNAPQLCTPPQQFTLPAAAMTSVIPGEPPAAQPTPAQAPPSMQSKEQAAPVQLSQTPQGPSTPAQQQQPAVAPPQYTASVINIPKPPSYTQPPISQGYTPAAVQAEQKRATEIKPTTIAQPKAVVVTPTLPVAPKPQTPQQALESAALKAEQERISELKANQELKNMLVKEVNDFQNELYRFTVKTKATQAKLQRDIDTMTTNTAGLSVTSDQLKKECSLDDMRGAIVQLKLELVRACAVIAEARTHAEAKDCHQWTQADPLTTKRVASIKKLAYYVQNQLEQAQKALDYKWNEALRRDTHFNKPGQRMIRPILDDVYQPLVKQQEILSRQQAVLRTLRNTLKDCDVPPMFKTSSLLRNTPFKNKDPLSKLTKNILNMSIEPETTKEPLLSSQKLDALRDMLSNHKIVKIKPVNVEVRQHLANMKLNYAKTLKEKSETASAPEVKSEIKPVVKAQVGFLPNVQLNVEPKQELSSAPKGTLSFTPSVPVRPPVPGLANVTRTLFTNEPKPEPSVKAQMPQATPKSTVSAFISQYSPITPVTPLTPSSSSPMNQAQGSVLKDLLQNKQTIFDAKPAETKNDANTFMGQKICSPSTFAFSSGAISSAGSTATKTTPFATKPTSEVFSVFNKYQPQSFVPESKPFVPESKPQTFEPKSQPPTMEAQPQRPVLETKPLSLVQDSKPQIPGTANSKSSETGEPEAIEIKTFARKLKTGKPLSSIFDGKAAPSVSSSNVPDVLKTTQDVAKTETKAISKIVEKENLPEKSEVKVKTVAGKKEEAKTLPVQTNKTSTFEAAPETYSSGSSTQSSAESIPALMNPEFEKEKPVSPTSNASSIFATGNATVPRETRPSPLKFDEATLKPEPVTPASTPVETVPPLKPSIFSSNNSSTAASVFGAAIAAQAKNTSQASSIFAAGAASSPPTPSSIFGSTSKGSIFGSSQTSVFASTTKPTCTTTTESSALNSQAPDSTTEETPSSTFGLPVTTSQTTSIFSSSVFPTLTTTSSSTPVMGSSTTAVFASATTKASSFDATATTSSVFSSTAATTHSSIFSSIVTASTSSAFTPTTQSVFGASTATTTTSGFTTSGESVFASTAANSNQTTTFDGQSTTTQASSIFGSVPAAKTSAQTTPPSTTQASIFGTPPPTTQTSVLGTPPATTQASIFGTPPPTTQASVFGTQPTTTQASIFGTPPPTTQASVFGSTPAQTSVFGTSDSAAAQSTSLFGGAETNLFAAASISTTSAPSQSSGGSIFGGSSSGSVFGSNTNVFGGKATFGQANPTAASIFGGGGATTFGQKPTSSFWSGGNGNTEGGFGSSSGAFGQQATTQASSIFGGSTGGSFSTPSAGQGFGTPQQGVFSTPQQQSSTEPAFGGSTVFGGNQAAFGSPPSFGASAGGFGSSFGGFNKSPSSGFGAPAAFGGAATFGGTAFGNTSPGKAFSGGNSAPAFSSSQSNATFESLATQNTLTFGNLAQQSTPTQQAAPSYNASPSFTGWRG